MDIFFIITGLILCIVGLIGSFFPIIPGPITSWIGLVFLHFTSFVPLEIYFLLGTFMIAISIFILDLIIPIIGLKKFGGTRGGQIGAIIGLVIGFFFGPIGLLAGPFLGALSGEIINKSKINIAIKASFGTLLGFIVGASMKFIISFIFLLAFFQKLLTFNDFF
mgnify:FL=1